MNLISEENFSYHIFLMNYFSTLIHTFNTITSLPLLVKIKSIYVNNDFKKGDPAEIF